jgi:hypothetical protein
MMHKNLSNNPLLRRVQRHANMATLFRQPDADPVRPPAKPSERTGETAVSPPQPQPEPAESAAEERDWQRLQRFYRKHEARLAADDGDESEK